MNQKFLLWKSLEILLLFKIRISDSSFSAGKNFQEAFGGFIHRRV